MSHIMDEEKSWVARDFGLDRRLIKALAKLNFIYPTLVQSKCIPIAIQGKDVLVRARTGSGKTLAFGLPLLHKLLVSKNMKSTDNAEESVFGIILAPTKELCNQIKQNLNDIIYYCKDIVTITSLVNDDSSLPKNIIMADIIITTPARIVKYINANLINISHTKMLVIDEADLILSFGYAEDVQVITSSLPKIIQGLLMSATLSPALDKFKRVVLNNPAILKLEEPQHSGKLLQFYLNSTPQDKYLILYVFLKLGLLQGKGLIFVNDVNKCYRLKLVLQQFFINAAVLNSEMPLNSRLHILDEFNRGVFDYLIATDASIDAGNDDDDSDEDDEDNDDDQDNNIESSSSSHKRKHTSSSSASAKEQQSGYGVHRGLDFQGVSFVVNFDFPATSAAYTHRIGRTARAGASGTALSFICLPKYPGDTNREEDTSQRDNEILHEIQHDQPRLGIVEGDNILAVIGSNNTSSSSSSSTSTVMDEATLQPSPLAFDMKEIESFRYRVEDTVRSVTAVAVKELRTAELKKEILNSEKLKTFFVDNPNDFKILRHDKAITHPIKIKEHLKAVPTYLIPSSMQAIASNQYHGKRKKKARVSGQSQDQRVNISKMRDPLRNPHVSVESSASPGQDESSAAQESNTSSEPRMYSSSEASHLGHGISGRMQWKMRHHKGPYNAKTQNKMKNSKKVAGTFQGKKGA